MTWARVTGSLIVRPERAPIGPDERRMLDAVIADPDDDGPRLVYADWLMARPEPLLAARGELIVVQCTLERPHDPAEGDRLKARDLELVECHGNVWCAQVGLGIVRNNWYDSLCGADFHRGFLETVAMPTGDYPRVAARLFAHEPVRRLDLAERSPDVIARLPGSIYLRRLRALALHRARLAPGELAKLAGSDHVASLVRLEVEDDRIGDPGAEAIARSTALRGLRELSLAETGIRTAGAYTLTTSKLAPQLEVLVLDGNPIGDEGALELARSAQLGGLRRLSLRAVELREGTRRQLAERFGAALEL